MGEFDGLALVGHHRAFGVDQGRAGLDFEQFGQFGIGGDRFDGLFAAGQRDAVMVSNV